MAALRVGIISPYSLTLHGGVQSQVLSLARALRTHDIDARVLGPCDGAPPEVGVTPLGVSLPTAANGSVAPLAPDIPAQLRTIRALKEEDFDVLHLHEPLCPGPTMTATLIKPCPIIATFHAAGRSSSYRWVRRGTNYLADRLDMRCAVSKPAEDLAKRWLGGDYERVFNGVEVSHFADAAPWPRASDEPTIFFIGRHEERKGLRVLLDALEHLPPNVRIWAAGDGPETEQLQMMHRNNSRIDWLGPIGEAEKIARLRAADVFCAPSIRGESFGIVLLEAMAAQTPIVAGDLPGYASVAVDGEHARLVQVDDHRALAEALREVMFTPELQRRLVANGIARAEQYSMRRLADRYISLYERVLASA